MPSQCLTVAWWEKTHTHVGIRPQTLLHGYQDSCRPAEKAGLGVRGGAVPIPAQLPGEDRHILSLIATHLPMLIITISVPVPCQAPARTSQILFLTPQVTLAITDLISRAWGSFQNSRGTHRSPMWFPSFLRRTQGCTRCHFKDACH